jgi:hypothetical protein
MEHPLPHPLHQLCRCDQASPASGSEANAVVVTAATALSSAADGEQLSSDVPVPAVAVAAVAAGSGLAWTAPAAPQNCASGPLPRLSTRVASPRSDCRAPAASGATRASAGRPWRSWAAAGRRRACCCRSRLLRCWWWPWPWPWPSWARAAPLHLCGRVQVPSRVTAPRGHLQQGPLL